MPKPVFIQVTIPKKPGRPTLLNPARQSVLLNAIKEGMPLKQAAEIAGISYDTLNHWRNRGEVECSPPEYRQFCQLLRRSQAVAMQVNLSYIHQAASRDWRAAAWMLERRFPDEFGREQIEHKGAGGNLATAIPEGDYEVLRRMRKQAGVRRLTEKLGAFILEKQQQEKEATMKKLPSGTNAKSANKPPARLRE